MRCTDADNLCSKAIVEARKWLNEKKAGSSPPSYRADISCGLKSVAVQHVSYSRSITFWC